MLICLCHNIVEFHSGLRFQMYESMYQADVRLKDNPR